MTNTDFEYLKIVLTDNCSQVQRQIRKNIENIVEQYGKSIRKIICSMTGAYNEDLEQEVYIKTYKNIDKYKETGKFKSWINTITANLCRDYLKSSYFKHSQDLSDNEQVFENIKDNHPDLLDEFSQKLRQKRIITAIDSLKPKFREVIVLYEMQGLSCEEISKKLNCPLGTVKSRLFNARKELAEMLKDLI